MKKLIKIKPKHLPNKGFKFEKAYRYAKLMEQGVEFPPVQVFYHHTKKHLTFNDGRNRVAACKLLGIDVDAYINVKEK